LLRQEIALLDLRHEAAFATGHPLFAANMAAGRIAIEAAARLPRKDVPIVKLQFHLSRSKPSSPNSPNASEPPRALLKPPPRPKRGRRALSKRVRMSGTDLSIFRFLRCRAMHQSK
jgi:hypothetical protein